MQPKKQERYVASTFVIYIHARLRLWLKDKDNNGEHKTRFAGSFIERCSRDSICLCICVYPNMPSRIKIKKHAYPNIHRHWPIKHAKRVKGT